jgi:acetate---CoA ligase (ADP-forming)
VFSPLTTGVTEYGRTVRVELADVPMMRETERTLRVMATLAQAAARPVHVGAFYAPPADTETTRAWRKRAAMLNGPTALNEVESKSLLRAYGVPVPPERFVPVGMPADPARESAVAVEVAASAREIGFPVVLKAVSAAVTHKSDAGLVITGIANDAQLQQAAATLMTRARAHGRPLNGILVARQIGDGIETVLGITHDVEMGPTIMVGLGGVWVELFRDVAFAPATLDRERARAMVQSTRARKLLDGFRAAPPADIEALIDALLALGRLACDIGDIVEAVDINPFSVGARGHGSYALDALVVLRPPATREGS